MKTIRAMLVTFTIAAAAQPALSQERHTHQADTPRSMRDEHEEILWALSEVAQQPGEVGSTAAALKELLQPHLIKEEQVALPPLGLLATLLELRDVSGLQGWLLPMTDTLRAALPRLLDEHKTIGAARERLKSAATTAKNATAIRLADDLARHALAEEEMFYPMAILVGEIVRGRMADHT